MMLSLRDLQEQLQEYVINKDEKVLAAICNAETNGIERVDIYRDGYSLRLLEILEKSFPILVKMIGTEKFTEIGRQYIDAYPSHDFNVCLYGRYFPQFLFDQQYDPFWSEVAEFEWALSLALDAPDAPQIDATSLGGITAEDWPYLQFTLHPSIAFYQFQYNTPKVVLAYLYEQDPPEIVREDQPKDWVVWRLDLQSYFDALTTEQVWMMSNINQGKTFAELCEGLCQWLPEEEVGQFAAGSLGTWLQKGIFSGFMVAPH